MRQAVIRIVATMLVAVVLLIVPHLTSAEETAAPPPGGISVQAIYVDGAIVYAGVSVAPGLYRSTDNGSTWSDYGAGLSTSNVMAIMRKGSDLLVATWGGGVFRRAANDPAWSPYSQGLEQASYVNSLAIVGTDVYVLAPDHGVYRRGPGSTKWEDTSNDLPSLGGSIRCVFLFSDGAHLWVGLTGFDPPKNQGLYEYEVGRWAPRLKAGALANGVDVRAMQVLPDGKQWLATSNGMYSRSSSGDLQLLPGTKGWYATAVRRNPGYQDGLFAGLNTGQVYRYLDSCACWQQISLGISGRVWSLGYLQDQPWRLLVGAADGLYVHDLPPVILTASSSPGVSATLQNGDLITYTVAYTNLSAAALSSVDLWYSLPVSNVTYVYGGTWLAGRKEVYWAVDTVPGNGHGQMAFSARVTSEHLSRAIPLVSDGVRGIWTQQEGDQILALGQVQSKKVLNWMGGQPWRTYLPYVLPNVVRGDVP